MAKAKRKKDKPVFIGVNGKGEEIICDSEIEAMFSFWCRDLQKAKIIRDFYRGETVSLSEGEHIYYDMVKGKRKLSIVHKKDRVVPKHDYTSDFVIEWEREVPGLVTEFNKKHDGPSGIFVSQNGMSEIEIKPTFDMKNMTRIAGINASFLWETKGKILNITIVGTKKMNKNLFFNTFIPREYLKTPTGKDRKIEFSPVTIEEYLQKLYL